MASLTATGLGSGLDIEGLVTKLMAVEQIPITQLSKQEASYQAKITAYGTLNSSLSTFQSSVSALADSTKYKLLGASVADTSIATVTASDTASTGTYSLEVDHIAQSQKLRTSSTYTATTSTLGSGTLTIDFGTYAGGTGGTFSLNNAKSTQTITIASGQNTLSGVRDAINAAGAGVTASIVNDGTGYRLLIASNDTGTANALRIQTTGTLSALAYDATGTLTSNQTESQVAKDAVFTLDGISFTKSSNSVTDAVDGVSINLLKSNLGDPTTVSVTRDTSSVTSLVTNFVSAYNTLKTSLNSLTSYNSTTKVAGLLQGDSTTLSIQTQLRAVFNTALSYTGGSFTTLSDIGVSFKKDGTLSLNSTTLASALADTSKDIASLFTTLGKPTDSLVSYSSGLSSTKPGAYAVNITKIASQSSLIGNAALGASTVITSGSNDALTLTVDGEALSITLTAGTYTPATLAAEVQAKVNGALGTSGSTATAASVTAASSLGNVDISAFTFPFSPDSSNDSLDVTISGTTKTISLFGGTYATAAELAAGVEEAITTAFGSSIASVTVNNGTYLRIASSGATAVTVAADGTSTLASDIFGTTTDSTASELSLTSNAYGSNSTVVITGGTAAATLFGTAITGSTGADVAGTIGGVAASGFGQLLTATTGDPAGLQIKVAGGSTGSRGTVNFDHGIAVQIDSAIDDITSTTGLIANKTSGINSSIKTIDDRVTALNNRLASIEARYRTQFNALDSLISSLQKTSSYLTQQLATNKSTS